MESYTRSSAKPMRERSIRFPRRSSMRSSVSSPAESTPRARKSILIMRASSTESLSHWMRTRPGMADCSRGTSSASGREEITMPPTCSEMWRGKGAGCSTPPPRGGPRGAGSPPPALFRAPPAPPPPFARLPQPVQLRGRQPQRLPHLPHGAADAVGGEGGDEPHVVTPEVLVDAQDQLLADVAGKVQVDVGHRGHLLVQEAPQEEVVLDGVDVRQPDQVADDGADGGAATAAGRRVAGAATHLLRHLVGEPQYLAGGAGEA